MIHYIDPSIRLLNSDDWSGITTDAWLRSRPLISKDDVDISTIIKIDTPVTELSGLVVSLTIPILIRDIICNARDHSIWAQTSRNSQLTYDWDLVKLDLPDEVVKTNTRYLHDNYWSMMKEVNQGVNQDEFRRYLPLGSMTSMTARFSLRSFIKLTKYFKYLSEISYSLHRPFKILYEDARVILITLFSTHGVNVDEVLRSIRPIELVHPLNGPMESCSFSGYTVISSEIPLSLYAQIIRHRNLSIRSNLMDYVIDEDSVVTLGRSKITSPIMDTIKVQLGADDSTWNSILSKRSCWIAQSTIWNRIINTYLKLKSSSDTLPLPCSDGICPYSGDCIERLNGNDPGTPCPRHYILDPEAKHYPKPSDTRLKDYIEDTDRPSEFWNSQVSIMENF